MKVVVLRTYSLSCNPIYQPLRRLGHDISEIVYCAPPGQAQPPHAVLPAAVRTDGPDWVLMIGQHDDGHSGFVPPPTVLAEIARWRPTIHLCCDGSERVWWPQLESYWQHVPFALHVNIDGVCAGFFGHRGLTTLCPIDAEPFGAPAPLRDREVRVGFCGGWGDGHTRGRDVESLLARGAPITAVKRPFGDYDGYRAFLQSCRCVWNHAVTGSDDHMHVKARVVETALAGALLLEQEGSPAADWFVPGEDYLTWRGLDDVVAAARLVDSEPEKAQAIAERLTEKAVARHSAGPFWRRILAAAGIEAKR